MFSNNQGFFLDFIRINLSLCEGGSHFSEVSVAAISDITNQLNYAE